MYNVEMYIKRCLLSCINQTGVILGRDYEIVCVNDGSPDNSGKIAKYIAGNHVGIRVIEQSNQGLSSARNIGLKEAKGDYLWFVDSDDWIEENCLSDIFARLNCIDILQIQYRYAYDNAKNNKEIYFSIDGIKSGREVLLTGSLPAPVPFSIYRREFLLKNNLGFVLGIYHEDSEFKPRAVYFAESITSIDKVCYNYYQRSNGSITSTFKSKNAVDLLFVMNSLYDFCKDKDEEYKKAFYSLIGLDMNSLLFGYWKLDT